MAQGPLLCCRGILCGRVPKKRHRPHYLELSSLELCPASPPLKISLPGLQNKVDDRMQDALEKRLQLL